MTWISMQLLVLVILVLLCAFFASSEVSFTGLTLAQIKRTHRVKPGFFRIWEKSPDRVLGTLLLSTNAVVAAVGAVTAVLAHRLAGLYGWDQGIITLLLSLVSGTMLLIFGEILPKVWAQRFTLAWAMRVTLPIKFLCRVISPFTNAAVRVTRFIIAPITTKERRNPFLQETELKRILTHSSVPTGAKKILNNVLDFSNYKVLDVMTPRSQVVGISAQQPMEKIIRHVIQSGLSRVLVYSGTLDNLKGILYSKDLLVASRSGTLILLEDLLRPVRFVEPGMPLPDLLRIFRSGRQHLAVVREGASPRVLGVVTIQDALESIVGSIREEM